MDPKDMTDEQLQTVITTGVEPEVEEPKEVVPEVETPAEVVETPPIVEDEPEEPVATAPVVEEERPPSRRESLRIQQLIDRMKQTAPEPKAQAPRNDALDYATALDADPEVIRQLEADRTAASDASYNAGLAQANSIQFHTRLEIDAPKVEAKYKFLDPLDKENFDPVRANAMNTLYLNASGYDQKTQTALNPNIRYAEFVEAQMEFAEALLADRQIKTTKNIAKQTAQTGLRPDGSSAKRLNLNQSEKTMSLEELYAAIGQSPPKK